LLVFLADWNSKVLIVFTLSQSSAPLTRKPLIAIVGHNERRKDMTENDKMKHGQLHFSEYM
jgi:hypothetical protein